MRTSCPCAAGAAEPPSSARHVRRGGRAAVAFAVGVALALGGCAGRPSRPASTPPPAPAGGQPSTAAVHQVQRGETLAAIARRHGTDYETLARLNGIRAPYTIYPGQSLRLPGSASGQTADIPAAPPGGWAWPTRGRTVRGYDNAHGGNKGLDIAGQLGQPIRAAAAGTVVYAGNGLRQYGNLLIVKHTPDYLTAYGHLQRIDVAEGAAVTQGQTIASMGSPGDGTGLLHFEIRLRGTPIDPAGLLPPSGG